MNATPIKTPPTVNRSSFGVIGSGKWADNITACFKRLGLTVRRASARYFFNEGSVYIHRLKSFADGLSGVAICTSPKFQSMLFPDLLQFSSNFLLEKPIATCAEELARYKSLSRRPRVVMIDHLDEKHPAMRIILSRCAIQKPKFVYYRLSYPYERRPYMNPLFEYGPHGLSLIQNIFNGAHIYSCEAARVPRNARTHHDYQYNYTIRVCDEGRLVAVLEVGNSFPYKVRDCIVSFEKEELIFRDRDRGQLWARSYSSLEETPIPFDYKEPLFLRIRAFVESCAELTLDIDELTRAILYTESLLGNVEND